MSKKILIVDDEPDIAKVLAVRLVDHGFDVQIAHSGKDALARISQNMPDLIILDIMMPYISGTELAAQLKENKETAMIPVIFLSALQSKQEEKVQGNAIGEDFLFAKPYEIKDLVAKIHQILG